MQKQSKQIVDQIFQVINKLIFTEKKKVFKFEGISLYPSEVHLMLVIQNDIDTNATQMANKLGLTKGAVSQTISRLEKKGILIKTKDPYNKNELQLSLTSFGKKMYEFCQLKQHDFIKAHRNHLEKLKPKEKEVILQFLEHMERAIDELN